MTMAIVQSNYLLRLRPFLLGQKLVLYGALHGAAQAVHTVVAVLGRHAAKGQLGPGAFLLEKIVEAMFGGGIAVSEWPRLKQKERGKEGRQHIPEAELTVAGCVNVPVGDG